MGRVPELVCQAKAHLREGRIETLAYDRAADSSDIHLRLAQEGVKPGIENGNLWKHQTQEMLPGQDGNSNMA